MARHTPITFIMWFFLCWAIGSSVLEGANPEEDEDEDANGYVQPVKRLTPSEQEADRQLSKGLWNWAIGDSLEPLKPILNPELNPRVIATEREERRLDAISKKLRDDQNSRAIGEILVSFIGAVLTRQPVKSFCEVDERRFQDELYGRVLDQDGFLVPRLAKQINRTSGMYLLSIYITGTKNPTIPALLVHPLLGDDRVEVIRRPHELMVKWAGAARTSVERNLKPNTIGRWEFRPVIVSMGPPTKVIYPRELIGDARERPEQVPSYLRLIRFGNGPAPQLKSHEVPR